MVKRSINWSFVTGLIMGLGIETISLLFYFHIPGHKAPVVQEAAAPVKAPAEKHWVVTNVSSSELLRVDDAHGDEIAINFDGTVKTAKGNLSRLCDTVAEDIGKYNIASTYVDFYQDISVMLAARLIQAEYGTGKSCMPKDIYLTTDKPLDASQFVGMLVYVGNIKSDSEKSVSSTVGAEIDIDAGNQKGPSK